MRRLTLLATALLVALASAPLVEAQELLSNIQRRVNSATDSLDKAEDLITRGEPKLSLGHIKGAQKEYDNIFNYYPGKFDPEHPTLVALKKRIAGLTARARQAPAAGAAPAATTGAAAAGATGGRAAAQQLRARLDAASFNIQQLRNRGDTSAKTLETARKSLAEAEAAFKKLTTTYSKYVDTTGNGGFLGAKHAYNSARENFQYIERHNDVTRAAAAKAGAAKRSAAVKAIHERYSQQGISGKRHRGNIGRFIWSKKEIGLKSQDQAVLSDTFKLSDPIFGRLYSEYSMGNTPVYQEGAAKPKANSRFGYEYRLYIDGKNVPVKFGVFVEGRYRGKFPQWNTTWQFGPHPVPADKAFEAEANAWRTATKNLSKGRHRIRFEFWSKDGSYRSQGPTAVGEFTLLVGAGERIAATGTFPADSYGGGDLKSIRQQMRKALVGPVTKSADQVLDVSVIGDWAYGRYTDTKIRYRKITGTVLWADSDDDKVCRYNSYVFISDEAGGGKWSPVRYRAFRTGPAHEGDVECPAG
ncbi:MAG: hypothetical protein QF893_02310 [Alphaproteobacteria bacterium]|jgi:hypothetical protein|nr:hypothetical protein [Alphaproteobacteria bacterium]